MLLPFPRIKVEPSTMCLEQKKTIYNYYNNLPVKDVMVMLNIAANEKTCFQNQWFGERQMLKHTSNIFSGQDLNPEPEFGSRADDTGDEQQLFMLHNMCYQSSIDFQWQMVK